MRRTAWVVAGLCFAAASVPACKPRTTKVGGGDDLPEDQWSRGVFLYGQNCAGCHGDDGEGDEETPAIAGEGGYDFAHHGPAQKGLTLADVNYVADCYLHPEHCA